MENVVLVKGKCPSCKGTIGKEWAGEDPSLGCLCRNCHDQKVFKPENVEIAVQKHLSFDPLLGIYGYNFDWRGSRIMVNGKIGVITSPQGDGDFVRFEGDEKKNSRNLHRWCRLLGSAAGLQSSGR